jgi:Uncharacterised nucleotidyltransferase
MHPKVEAQGAIRPDISEEAVRLLDAAEQAEVPVRLLGGVAVLLRVADRPASLERAVEDIDLATPKGHARGVSRLLSEHGYEPNATFNALHGAHRMIFEDPCHDRHVDVFVGRFQMCHELPFDDRLEVDRLTLPLADLVMTKLQIVKLNAKDLVDLYLLLLTYDVADHDREAINADRIAALCARDWGIYRTFQINLGRLPAELDRFGLDEAQRATIRGRARALEEAIEGAPKSRKWKLRARVGDRVRWYDDPEEPDEEA